jgi:hypothetical protein
MTLPKLPLPKTAKKLKLSNATLRFVGGGVYCKNKGNEQSTGIHTQH